MVAVVVLRYIKLSVRGNAVYRRHIIARIAYFALAVIPRAGYEVNAVGFKYLLERGLRSRGCHIVVHNVEQIARVGSYEKPVIRGFFHKRSKIKHCLGLLLAHKQLVIYCLAVLARA